MKLRYLLCAAASLLMLAACETRKEQMFYADDADAVQISASVGCEHTKSSPLGGGQELRSFSVNDVVCVFNDDLTAEYYMSSTGWKPTDRYYFRWNTDPVTFYAYYPVNKSSGYDKFAVRVNQYSAENLIASDYMTGVAENKYREPVEIKLHRRMAKVTVRIAGLASGQKVQSFKIGSYSVYEEGKPGGSTSISPYVETASIPAGENGTVYTALIIPGPASSQIPFVTMTYNGKSLKSSGIPAFEAGYAYKYTVTVGASSVTLSEPEVSCWSEALPVEELPENPGEDPGEDPGDEPGDDPVTPPAKMTNFFVTPSGAGDKSGSSWENAMGMNEFRPLISSDYGAKTAEQCEALNGLTFHFMEGSYCTTTSEKDRLKLAFNAFGRACLIKILGGYDSSSTGTDLTKRDIAANVTEFTGDRNGNGKADSGDTGIFCIDAWVNLTIDGCTFAHSYGADRWKQKALMVNTDAAGAVARVNVSNCVFHDLYDYADSDAKYQGGCAVWLYNNSVATVHNCKFYDCHATSRGGALRTGAGSSVLFVNNCAIYENAVNKDWGQGIQISNGTLCMNNSTVAKNTGKGAAVNGGGNWLVVNSTILNDYVSGKASTDMTLRNESVAENNAAILMNSIVLFDGDKPSIHVNDDNPDVKRELTSKGHNLYNSVSGQADGFITAATDKSGQTVSGLGLTWNAGGYYTWNGNVDGFTKAKLADIENVLKTGCNKAVGPFTNVGNDFYNWLQSLESGKNPLALDQAGNARTTTAMWPGAYEKH